ncbi:MAG: hypothetical protein ACK5LP_08685 [Campylobacteraceae bacterium]
MKYLFKNNRLYLAVVIFFLSFTSLIANDDFVLENTLPINEKVYTKINEMGKELKEKSGVSVYAIAGKSIGNQSIKEYIDEKTKELQNPYAVLLIVLDEHIVDILNSQELDKKFNKKNILSPFPFTGGSVLPLLGDKRKDHDKYSAAMLNGYADLSEQIAKSYDIKLDSAIGNANRNVLNTLRFFIYGFLVVCIGIYIYRRVKYKNAKS